MNIRNLIGIAVGLFLAGCQTPTELSVMKNGNIITIAGNLPNDITNLEIQFYSDRNNTISHYLEIADKNPEKDQLIDAHQALDWDIYYPIVDVKLKPSMQAYVSFEEPIDSTYSINGMFHQQLFKLKNGTALWSLLFYKLYSFTNEAHHLETARKALLWCLNNQYDGEDLHAHGGLVGVSQ
ncbi:MAG: hypothetical protein ABJN25_17530 [Ekhidna sp.]